MKRRKIKYYRDHRTGLIVSQLSEELAYYVPNHKNVVIDGRVPGIILKIYPMDGDLPSYLKPTDIVPFKTENKHRKIWEFKPFKENKRRIDWN